MATNLAYERDGLGIWIFGKDLETIEDSRSREDIASNSNAHTLSKSTT